MIYLTLFLIQFFFCTLLYLFFKRKFEKVISSDTIKNEIDSLIIAFNRNAEDNITILDNRISLLKNLITQVDEKTTTLNLLQKNDQNKKKLLSSEIIDVDLGPNKKKKRQTLKKTKTTITQQHKANEKISKLLIQKDKKDFEGLEIIEKVRLLKKRNKSIKEIAMELDISQSEVKLMTSI